MGTQNFFFVQCQSYMCSEFFFHKCKFYTCVVLYKSKEDIQQTASPYLLFPKQANLYQWFVKMLLLC